MKNETLECMNEKRNRLHSFAHFSGLFHSFQALSQFSGIFPSVRVKTYASTVRTWLKMPSGKRAALGHFVPSGRALFPSGIFHLCSNYYKEYDFALSPMFFSRQGMNEKSNIRTHE